jgi:16S rRNA (adenine1518-N6/adenine1519-N6)-dimethyltransferase
VELDAGLAHRLRTRFAAEIGDGALHLVEGDILDQDIGRLVAPPYDVVANLPYHITSPILHLLLGSSSRPHRAVLMVQREVGERIAAPAGGLSYVGVFVQYHAAVRIARIVRRDAFEPAPRVESAVVVIEPYPPTAADRLPPDEEDELWRLVMAAFRERRKMLRNVLPRQLGLDQTDVEASLQRLGIDPDRRPQTLTVGEWCALRAALSPLPPDRRGRAERVRGSQAM